jgi:hypothetical protein
VRPSGALAAFFVLAVAACADDPPPAIVVEERVLHVRNLTQQPWSGVEIWMNDHYRVTRSTMAAGERLHVPLDLFVAGFGQRFDPARASVRGVEVTATSAAGPVRLVWGSGRRR